MTNLASRPLDQCDEFYDTLLGTKDAVFLVDEMDYLAALTKIDLSGHLDYTNRNNVKKLLQTVTMRIERIHENLNGSQTAFCAWLPAYAYYNHLESTSS